MSRVSVEVKNCAVSVIAIAPVQTTMGVRVSRMQILDRLPTILFPIDVRSKPTIGVVMNRPNPPRGLYVFLAAIAVGMLAVASRIEQPPIAAPAVVTSLSVASSD